MFEVGTGLPLSVDFSADPFVIELGDQATVRRDLRFDVFGVDPGHELQIEVLPIPEDGGFTFALDGRAHQHRTSRSASQPIEVTVPIRVRTDEVRSGREGRTQLSVKLRLTEPAVRETSSEPAAPEPTETYSAGLVAASNRALPIWQVLREEYLELLDDKTESAIRSDRELADPNATDEAKLARLYSIVHGSPGPSALCFSGGGIRSATFNLGALQALADHGLLEHFDYLSSVSGGGYVSSWLAGWIHRSGGLEKVVPYLQPPRDGVGVDVVKPEAYPLRFLRRYSNYLTPRLGSLSPDTWTVAAIVLRNLILNWLVFLPVLGALLALPLLVIARGWPVGSDESPWLYGVGLAAGGIGLFFMSTLRASADPITPSERSRWDQRFLTLGLVPMLAATALLPWAAALFVERSEPSWIEALPWCAGWTLAVPMVAFILGDRLQRRLDRPRPTLGRDLLALLASGTLTAVLFAAIVAGWAPTLLASPMPLYPLLAPGIILGGALLGKGLFVAVGSVAEDRRGSVAAGEADREWWARWSAWTLIPAVSWIVGAAIVFLAATVLDGLIERVSALVATGGLGGLVSRLGKGGSPSRFKDLALAFAAPLFCLLLLLLVAWGTQALLAVTLPPVAQTVADAPEWWVPPYRGVAWQIAVAIAVLLGGGFLVGRFVDVNRFSLQAMYRNRLVRAYLGASNTRRRPNLFTGFDPNDDLPLHRLRGNRPWPVINIALNLVGGEDLAWQERKAESFTATPLHCGSAQLGYRRSQVYGGDRGLSLGAAVATSGAAASPNMGYHSSPAISFIMALFNARLGAWLGNPGEPGARTYTRSGPAESARLLIAEALGRTDDRQPYVYLSDGGHFENLGLYEMVRRRCRFIVVCDAGCDPACNFDDLGNAIRKVRIDLGVPIEFEERIRIYPKPKEEPVAGAAYCAVGTIDYPAVDGGKAKQGRLVYIKPAILNQEPYDVFNYARTSKDFPHESTADQWFSESQFESYRELGQHVIGKILGKGPHEAPLASLRELVANATEYLAGTSEPRRKAAQPRKAS